MKRERGDPLPGAPDPWAVSTMPPFRGRPPYVMTEMIAAEPALAQRLLHRLAADVAVGELARELRQTAAAGRPLVITGCGTSEHAAMAVAALLDEALAHGRGWEVVARQALEVALRPPGEGIVIGISHEGGTKVTTEALAAARKAGARTALVTVGRGSPAVAEADVVIATDEQDQSWCHTVGYLSPMLAGVALAAAIRGARTDDLAVRAILDITDDARPAADVAAGLAGVDRILVVGAGADAITARELALKIAEGARLPATMLDLETALHGHLAAATRWTGLVLVLTDAADEPLVHERATRVRAAARALGIPLAAILSEAAAVKVPEEETPAGRIVLPHTDRVPGLAGSLLASAVALQLLTERLARARHVDPDTLGREDPAQATAHA
ncbi:MAG TPA: SIS domain-containing protein [Candidatus Limnocylindria bacterium]|nr:SIS domain-containing protein [Candidatus Limnocylindria bacterium]